MDAPERIVIAGTLDECGNYYPTATEAEGEHGGFAVEYVRAADLADALEREAQQDERAARICEALHRKGVLPEKWADYFRVRSAGDKLLGVQS